MASQDCDIKLLRGLTPAFIVDGFAYPRPECRSYFLTHYHSDHTVGLSPNFSGSTIYCSDVTAALVVHDLGVHPRWVSALPMGTAVVIEGVEVTAIDANHCPGAIMLHFREAGKQGGTGDYTLLHCGDFRAEEHLRTSATLRGALGRGGGLDLLYLDTTYCLPRFDFPPQKDALASIASIVAAEQEREPRTLFAIAAYSLGKERVVEVVVRSSGGKCLVSEQRARVLRLCGWWNGEAGIKKSGELFTTNSADPDISAVLILSELLAMVLSC